MRDRCCVRLTPAHALEPQDGNAANWRRLVLRRSLTSALTPADSGQSVHVVHTLVFLGTCQVIVIQGLDAYRGVVLYLTMLQRSRTR